MTEWFLYMSQYRLAIPDFVARAQAAEASGFDGVAFFDHLETPGAPGFPVWEAMGIATWVAARTTTLRVGHLVLCDAFRHPAVLAKQAVTLAEASEGRFELGLGSGSMPDELAKFGLDGGDGLARTRRLDRDLTAIRGYWGLGERVHLAQAPTPTQPIPIVVGGTGPRMLEVVRAHADWWNLPADKVDRLGELAGSVGTARPSVQQMVGFAGAGSDPATVREASEKRWGRLGPGLVCGDADELVEYFTGLALRGVQRFYVWFADGARLESVEEFGATVIGSSQMP
ncbi:LLM class flavin-dependent oxidoreductase [Mycobacterium sp. AT1]|uniref:LLM class flavin-dependent oxidoreductase n=1 Tax=Mycobacterium sp. AT1 TaxID=1961706 RepID=UPI0009AC926D|nr:LLM class flavin-dependent oxidoreductase [Mycobacterium sp. AT1]OPX12763.1 NADP oxidoreductase [Mycobacterium sp. AT1]